MILISNIYLDKILPNKNIINPEAKIITTKLNIKYLFLDLDFKLLTFLKLLKIIKNKPNGTIKLLIIDKGPIIIKTIPIIINDNPIKFNLLFAIIKNKNRFNSYFKKLELNYHQSKASPIELPTHKKVTVPPATGFIANKPTAVPIPMPPQTPVINIPASKSPPFIASNLHNSNFTIIFEF
jgi:hypothetical protein